MQLKIFLSFIALVFVGVFFQNCAEDFGTALQAPLNGSMSLGSEHVVDYSDCSSGSCPDPNVIQACMFDGALVMPGEMVMAYKEGGVPYGSTCKAEPRICGPAGLSGTYQYSSCEVGAPASCLHQGVTVAHGQKLTAYAKSTVSYGQSCQPVKLTCSNGSLSPNPSATPYLSCEVGAPASCTYGGGNLSHGQKIMAYKKSSVPYGQKCVAVQVACNNGSLTNPDAVHASCKVNPPVVKWVQAKAGESHAQTCQRAGLKPSSDKGYGICASGERRPTKGTDYNKISYTYGTWGGAGKGGTQAVRLFSSHYFCYSSGQKRDNDGTDRLVAYLCSQ